MESYIDLFYFKSYVPDYESSLIWKNLGAQLSPLVEL